jgi:alginate O-acetyltransferase complex protein AlgI
MQFNSLDFAVFLPVVFVFYWALGSKKIKLQNISLLVSSYIFYGWWDWRFLILIFFSSAIDYILSLGLVKEQKVSKRRLLLWISIFINIGLLAFFKYFNFFIENFTSAFSFFGSDIKPNTLNIILPVGISFYTFQTLSYTIDVFTRKIEPSKDFISFAAFVSFFPQLVAGPIERASRLLPQFEKKRTFEYQQATNGLRQILWGLIKKVVIADNCAEYANLIFNNSDDYAGSTLIMGAIFFAFQIYGDFSGYSDIAIGTARLFGFDLMKNFSFPYFSRDIAEFWRRWHISLSTWFRDYLYVPLGGSRNGQLRNIRNIFIIFIVSGFWHGANWTYVIWGALNALYFLPLLLTSRNRSHMETVAKGRLVPTFREFIGIIMTFGLTILAWVFFRAENVTHAIAYISKIFSTSTLSVPSMLDTGDYPLTILLIILFVIVEWLGREGEFAIEMISGFKHRVVRWSIYGFLIFCIGMFMETDQTPFIYFQF